ncbi:MAG TPA: LacI family DNA-binding transcriptional regulator [Candidatus Acidoferrales bacterium]|nr:LacI family DNA-binding transcriptional regulator [Candidatus Acidoferrales bacterium]
MTVRLKDIARDLGVSVITVSKALRNHGDISPATRARVLKRVKELNYRPNYAARALVTGRTHMMGLVVPDLLHAFHSEVAKGLAGALRKSGFTLLIASTDEDPENERQAIDQFLARRVDALLVASTQWSVESFRRVEETGIPYILLDRNFAGLPANFVGVDDELVGRIATQHLVDIGCRTIAHIGGLRISPALGRLAGYKHVLAKHGLTLGPEYIVTHDQLDESAISAGYNATLKLLKLNPRPDGIFCFSDVIAIGSMNAIFNEGLRIPEDVAIVGCANVHYGDSLRVPLTSVDQQSLAIGQKAAQLAISLLESKGSTRPKTILLEPKLIVRNSTRKSAATSKGAAAR